MLDRLRPALAAGLPAQFLQRFLGEGLARNRLAQRLQQFRDAFLGGGGHADIDAEIEAELREQLLAPLPARWLTRMKALSFS